MAAFPQDFSLGGPQRPPTELKAGTMPMAKALLFGISTRTSREPPFRAPMAISPSITITAFVKMSP